jgi:PAS domain S-box-containing protein
VVLVFRDQAEERAAQQALRESRDRFKSVFEAANVGKSITQPGGQVNVNKAFADMLGYTQEELKGKTWQELAGGRSGSLSEGHRPASAGSSGRRAIHKAVSSQRRLLPLGGR